MPKQLKDYERKYGKLIYKNFADINSIRSAILYSITLFSAFFFGILLIVVDFSYHPSLSQLPPWFLKTFGMIFILGGFYVICLRTNQHGYCLFENGMLHGGSWRENCGFFYFKDIEKIIISPSFNTAFKIVEEVWNTLLNEAPEHEKKDWQYSREELELETKKIMATVLFVFKSKSSGYEDIPISWFKDIKRFKLIVESLAGEYGPP